MGAFLYKYGPFVSRLLLAPIFLYAGWGKFANLSATAAYIAGNFVMNAGLDPAAAAWKIWRPLAVTAGAIEIAGALLLVAGFRTRAAAVVLLLYLVPVTAVVHGYGWAAAADAQAANLQALSVFKNLAIVAALLQLATYGAGKPSVDNRF